MSYDHYPYLCRDCGTTLCRRGGPWMHTIQRLCEPCFMRRARAHGPIACKRP